MRATPAAETPVCRSLKIQTQTRALARALAPALILALTLPWANGTAGTRGGHYTLDPAASRLEFVATQEGAKFESYFERFTTLLRFDPAQPETGYIHGEIELSSVNTGNGERDEFLKTADWFDVARWPRAVFHADQIRAAGKGYSATGTLTLRDRQQPVTLTFKWTPKEGQPARLVGSAVLERLAFGVGQGEWQDTAYIGNGVAVRVHLTLVPGEDSDNTVSTYSGGNDGR